MDVPTLQAILLAQLDDNPVWVKDIASLFLETAPQMMAGIRAAIDGRDASALERAAHRIKGTLGTFQALEAARAAAALEDMAGAGDFAEAEARYAELAAALAQILEATRQLVASI